MSVDKALMGVSYATLLALVLAGNFYIIPINFNLVVTSMLTIYIGSHRSLYANEESETMETKDALMFPITAGITLTTLYALFMMFNKDMINYLIASYIFIVAVYALSQSFWEVLSLFLTSETKLFDFSIPLPNISLPSFLGGSSEESKDENPKESKDTDSKAQDKNKFDVQLTLADSISLVLGFGCAIWYIVTKHWIANNLIGITFAIQGIENLSVGSYKTGSCLLFLLFFYDIFFVFGTPVMVSVARNVDAPIKLLFLKGFAQEDSDAQFSMLGLGDIVIPGIFIALLLRFDAQQAGMDLKLAKTNPIGSFNKTYFNTNMVGYCFGLYATLFVMYTFKAAQPALLYLVPACLITSVAVAVVKGEFSALWAYTEVEEEEEDGKSKSGSDKKND